MAGRTLLLTIAILLMPIGDAVPIPFGTVIGGVSVAWAGAARIGGRRMSCHAAKVRLRSKSQLIAYATPGTIVLNLKLLRKHPAVVQRLIFLHECAHQYVGANEAAADCWAIRRARRQGWFSRRGLRKVCRAVRNSRGGFYHQAGPARCKAMKRCYNAARK